MLLKDITVGFGITGSFCTHDQIIPVMQHMAQEGANIIPIISKSVDKWDTRFGTADDLKLRIQAITDNKILKTIVDVEPFGPKSLLDVMLVAPCTGNTLAKIANGITDTAVVMAVKAQLRNLKPVVLSVSTNDGLAGNAKNLAAVLNMQNIYLVPLCQDDPKSKPNSLVANQDLIIETVKEALKGNQIQPVFC